MTAQNDTLACIEKELSGRAEKHLGDISQNIDSAFLSNRKKPASYADFFSVNKILALANRFRTNTPIHEASAALINPTTMN